MVYRRFLRLPVFVIVALTVHGAGAPTLAGPGIRFASLPPTLLTPSVQPSESPFEGMPIRDVRVEGLERVDPQLVKNQLRTRPGQPYEQSLVDEFDVPLLTRLNQFKSIRVQATPTDDGGVVVTFVLDEWTLIRDVAAEGNTAVSDQAIGQVVNLRAGDPIDTFQIDAAKDAIMELYKEKGYFLVDIQIDQVELVESGVVLFKIREGPRVRIRRIEFHGNEAFTTKILNSQIKTDTWIFLFRPGEVDEERISEDIRAISDYYRDRGYLDVRVDRELDLSPDQREAKVTFLIEEGPMYLMRDVRVEGSTRLLPEQAAALMPIKVGDVYSQDKIRRSIEAIENFYGRLGYFGTAVRADQLRDPDTATVELVLVVSEAPLAYTGQIRVIGNDFTQRKVILRELEFRPDRPLDSVAIERSEQRLQLTRLFELSANPIVAMAPDELDPLYRDVVVEVEETNTARLGFGAAVSTDLGLFASIDYEQRNFDLFDPPETLDELLSGQAFRGAGQTFALAIQPGLQYSNFSLSVTEPYILDTNNSLQSTLAFTTRELESYDETRYGGRFRLGRRIGNRWVVFGTTRWQSIDLTNIDKDAPRDVFAVENENVVSGLGFGLTRSTYDNRVLPTRGTKIDLEFEQIGALGGDFDFTRLSAGHALFLTLDEDFLGRKTVISFTTRASYLFGGTTPIYERLFLGGRSFRGFAYRTVGPKGIRNDNGKLGSDPVGGEWLFSWGAEYEYPIWSDVVRGVVFLDTGTILNDPGFDDYRVSAGMGIRLLVPQLGQVPMAFDFGFPLLKEDGDEAQIFSFSIDVPL